MRLTLFLFLTSCNNFAIHHGPIDAPPRGPQIDYVQLHHKICTIDNFDTNQANTVFEASLDNCLNNMPKRLNLYAF